MAPPYLSPGDRSSSSRSSSKSGGFGDALAGAVAGAIKIAAVGYIAKKALEDDDDDGDQEYDYEGSSSSSGSSSDWEDTVSGVLESASSSAGGSGDWGGSSSGSGSSSDWEEAAPSTSGGTSGSAGSGSQRGQSSSGSGGALQHIAARDRERINASIQGANHCLDWKAERFFNGLFWTSNSILKNKCSLPIVVGLAYLNHEEHGEKYRIKCQRDVFVLKARAIVQSGYMNAGAGLPEGAFVSSTMAHSKLYGFRNKDKKPPEKYRVVRRIAGTYNEDIHPNAKSEAIKFMRERARKMSCPK